MSETVPTTPKISSAPASPAIASGQAGLSRKPVSSIHGPWPDLGHPEEFAIITAYATTGETWSEERNQAAQLRTPTDPGPSAGREPRG